MPPSPVQPLTGKSTSLVLTGTTPLGENITVYVPRSNPSRGEHYNMFYMEQPLLEDSATKPRSPKQPHTGERKVIPDAGGNPP